MKKLQLNQETLRNLATPRKPGKDTLVFCSTERTCPNEVKTQQITCAY